MIYIYSTQITEQIDLHFFNEKLKTMSPALQEKMVKPIFLKDKLLGLLGKLLLQKGLINLGFGPEEIFKITYNKYKKPLLDSVYFNISHASNTVICTISTTNSVGVDIEASKKINLPVFENHFTPEEWGLIQNDNSLFFEYWTKKEAVIKAAGKGLSIPLQSFNTTTNCALVEDQQWFIKSFHLNALIVGSIATNNETAKCVFNEVNALSL